MVGKHSKHWRPLHNYWDYNGDGKFSKERIKGKDKRMLKKWRRLQEKREMGYFVEVEGENR